MKKNSKGFTLVELLAVIVVLAIIMVIATTQISGILKKNTVDSFKSSLDVVAKEAKTAYIQYGNDVDETQIASYVDYDEKQYVITLSTDDDDKNEKVCITSKPGGKFNKMEEDYIKSYFAKKTTKKNASGEDVIVDGKKQYDYDGDGSESYYKINGDDTTICKTFK